MATGNIFSLLVFIKCVYFRSLRVHFYMNINSYISWISADFVWFFLCLLHFFRLRLFSFSFLQLNSVIFSYFVVLSSSSLFWNVALLFIFFSFCRCVIELHETFTDWLQAGKSQTSWKPSPRPGWVFRVWNRPGSFHTDHPSLRLQLEVIFYNLFRLQTGNVISWTKWKMAVSRKLACCVWFHHKSEPFYCLKRTRAKFIENVIRGLLCLLIST